MPFTFSKVQAVIRAVRWSRQREVAAASAWQLSHEIYQLLVSQARQLEDQTNEARELAHELALTNEELRSVISEAKKAWAAADSANRSKAEFLTVMSHELRTPLNSIGGYVDLLEMELRGPLTDAQKSDLSAHQAQPAAPARHHQRHPELHPTRGHRGEVRISSGLPGARSSPISTT